MAHESLLHSPPPTLLPSSLPLLSLCNSLHTVQGAHGLDGRPGPVVSGARHVPIIHPSISIHPSLVSPSACFSFCLSAWAVACLLLCFVSVLCCLMFKALFRSLLRLHRHEYDFNLTLSLSLFGCCLLLFPEVPRSVDFSTCQHTSDWRGACPNTYKHFSLSLWNAISPSLKSMHIVLDKSE